MPNTTFTTSELKEILMKEINKTLVTIDGADLDKTFELIRVYYE